MRSKSVCACVSEISASRTRFSALLSEPMSGITFTLALTSSFLTFSPATLYISETMPDICGLMFTSSRGSILPVTMVFFSRSESCTSQISYTCSLGRDF